VRRKAGKAFDSGVEDPDGRNHLLLGGEKLVNEALGQALDLQAVFLAARPRKTMGQLVPTNEPKRPPTVGVLELWEDRPLRRKLPLQRKSRRQRPPRETR
jgi:hypothetical protein